MITAKEKIAAIKKRFADHLRDNPLAARQLKEVEQISDEIDEARRQIAALIRDGLDK
jgi:hypothetical protein